jgi:hypothetical protein
MKRREFMAAAGAASILPLANMASAEHSTDDHERDYLELRTYHIDSEEQLAKLGEIGDVVVSALNRAGISPVGVFLPEEGLGPVYMLLPHKSAESVVTVNQKLAADEEFLAKAADFINASADNPAYARMESSLLLAFKGMPHVATPTKSADRVFQLRIYESPSVKTGQKKIEMFNDAGELAIFKKTGLDAVFFGEAIVGSKMPNLTYMLGFDNMDAKVAAWKAFVSHPEWLELRKLDEYSDKKILCGITNIMLKPAPCSQI